MRKVFPEVQDGCDFRSHSSGLLLRTERSALQNIVGKFPLTANLPLSLKQIACRPIDSGMNDKTCSCDQLGG